MCLWSVDVLIRTKPGDICLHIHFSGEQTESQAGILEFAVATFEMG